MARAEITNEVTDWNPLNWQKEHQVALICAIIVGLVVGAVIGELTVPAYGYRLWVFGCDPAPRGGCFHFTPWYWFHLGIWSILGSAIATTLVYIRRLLNH
jgi:hypothetical protein